MPKKKSPVNLPPGLLKKRVKLLKEAPQEVRAKFVGKRRGPKLLSEALPRGKKPLTIVKIKGPITARRKGEPVPPPPHKPLKPAPRRSPMLKWHKKSR